LSGRVLRVVVLAVGNPLRGDDGAAWRVAEHVERHWQSHALEVLLGQQVLPEWAVALAGADVAYFVDAAIGRERVSLEPLQAAPRQATTAATHSLGPASVLRMAIDLFGAAAESYLLALPADDFDFSERLSPRTRQAVSDAIQILDRVLAERLD
jgi:hydrogenase maturation protease